MKYSLSLSLKTLLKTRSALVTSLLVLAVSCAPSLASASTTTGTIDSTNRYAWSENAGWIDFGTTQGAVTVTDSALTGYAYGENIGWISLNCSNTSSCTGAGSNPYAVVNNGSGTLSGSAWSENAGWIDFAPSQGGVSINSSGVFSGYAYSESLGWIDFTGDHPVTTDWRPASVRNASSAASASTQTVSYSSGGGSISAAQLASLLAPSASSTAYLNAITVPGCPSGMTCTPIIPTVPNCPSGYTCTPNAGTPPSLAPLGTSVLPSSGPSALPSSGPSALPSSGPSALPSSGPSVFTRNLTVGSTDSDVQALQQYLNTHGFTVASTGPGSPENETTTFGSLTKAALAKFQAANGISPAVGFFGPITRAFINSHQ